MSKLVVLVLITLLLTVSIHCKSDQGIRECIANLTKTDVDSICKNSDPNVERVCRNGYFSVTLCLINNNCQSSSPLTDMSFNCWHCWADLDVASDQMKSFQNKIRACWEPTFQIFVVAVLGLLLLLVQ